MTAQQKQVSPVVEATVRVMVAAHRTPTATYRLQFNQQFSFADALAMVPYLEALGVSDCYASPLFRARTGSSHGYDVCDYSQLNPVLGDEAAFIQLTDVLRERGMGLLMDMVPNHMGIGSDNPWWLDVLENGPSSAFASFFDIDWSPVKPELAGKVLLPILGDQYGVVLEQGELRLSFEEGAFSLRYYETQLPLAPRSYAEVLRPGLEHLTATLGESHEHVLEYQSILTAISYLPPRTEQDPERLAERQREKEIIKRRLASLSQASPEAVAAIQSALDLFNGTVGDPRSFDLLDALIENQAYRLAFWRVAAEEINYRRFFDINDLAALRVELPDVFRAAHELVLRLAAQGRVTGLRIDHPDGLWDPPAYFAQLQEHYLRHRLREQLGDQYDPEQEQAVIGAWHELARTDREAARPLYVVAEKILSDREPLPEDWSVEGTTGYDFLIAAGGLFVDSANERKLDKTYRRFTVPDDPLAAPTFPEIVAQTKQMIMQTALASEITSLCHQLERINEKNRRYRDFTLQGISAAVTAIISSLSIYRTYITGPETVSERDTRYLRAAVRNARRRNPDIPVALFRFLENLLLLRNLHEFRPQDQGQVVAVVMRFQQMTGPVMAKSVEDTAFYRYHRLVALNEVGGHPEHFGTSVAAFHRQNAARQATWPHGMLAGTTHDTKRSEDTRTRICVLSELPDEWEAALLRWQQWNIGHKTESDGELWPDRADEYLLYQTLIGAYEATPMKHDTQNNSQALLQLFQRNHTTFQERVRSYMEKATKEAKVHTSWINPDEEYDNALRRFITGLLDPSPDNQFLADLLPFQRRIAFFGRINSLAQTLLRLTSPGVPDTYQGTELWDFSLVDPDNRRPVDYAYRAALLEELRQHAAGGPEARLALVRELLEQSEDGRIKLYLTAETLGLRRKHADLFRDGDYQSLVASGSKEAHVCAFARTLGNEAVLVIVPRLVVGLTGGQEIAPIGTEVWGDTKIALPEALAERRLRNVLSGETIGSAGPELAIADALRYLPVALFWAE